MVKLVYIKAVAGILATIFILSAFITLSDNNLMQKHFFGAQVQKPLLSQQQKVSPSVYIPIGNSPTHYEGDGCPINEYYQYSITQDIYLQSQINTPGLISQLAFYIYGDVGSSFTFSRVQIFMDSTALTAFSTSYATYTNKVFDKTSYTVPSSSNGWWWITLDTPYYYSNVNNLLITVYSQQTGDRSPYTEYGIATSSGYQFLTGVSDSTNPPTYSGRIAGYMSVDLYMVPPIISVSQPVAGSVFEGGSTQKVSWYIQNGSPSFSVWANYSLTGSAPWTVISTIQGISQTAFDSSWSGNWTLPIPVANSATCKVEVTAVDYCRQKCFADSSTFTIVIPPTVIVSSPGTGTVWAASSNKKVSWVIQNGYPSYIVWANYSLTGGAPWTTISTIQGISQTSAGSWSGNWTLPASSSTNCIISVTVIDSFIKTDSANSGIFIIELPPAITVTIPTTGIIWVGGSTHTISWVVQNGLPSYKVWANYSLTGSAPWTAISTIQGISQTSAGSWSGNWTLPNANSNTCVVNLTVLDNYKQKGQANSGTFTIELPPIITVISPSTGTDFKGNSNQKVFWVIQYGWPSYTVWANYSLTGSAPWTPISTIQGISQTSVGSWSGNWTLPFANTTTCKINMTAIDSTMQICQANSGAFTIDSAPPIILSTIPTNLATSVNLTNSIIVQFSEKMSQSPTQTAFSIAPDPGGWSWIWNGAGDTMTGTHSTPFLGSTLYTVTISTTASDIVGNTLASPYSWTFTTVPPPNAPTSITIQGQSVSHGITHIIIHHPIITWVFNDPVTWDTQSGYQIQVNYSSNSTSVWDSGIVSSTTNSATYSGSVPLVDGMNYSLRIRNENTQGLWGSWSSLILFRMNTPPTQPINWDPPNGAVNLTIGSYMVRWNASNDAEMDPITYTWNVANSSLMTPPLISSGNTMNTNSPSFSTNYSATYFWRVIANDSYESSTWSGIWNFTIQRDIRPVVITLTDPANNTVITDLSTTIAVTFDKAVQLKSLKSSCTPDPTGWSITQNAVQTIAYFSHSVLFTISTTYVFAVINATDTLGNPLGPGSIPNPWTFQTSSTPAPSITATTPSNNSQNVPVTQNVVITFSSAINTTTELDTCTPSISVLSRTWSLGNTVLTITHNDFAYNTAYTFQVTNAKDTSGTPLTKGAIPNPWYFKTMQKDTTNPKITSTFPVNGSANVATSFNIMVNFSKQMDTSTLLYSIIPTTTGLSTGWLNANTTLTISHTVFIAGTNYTVQVTQCNDLIGNTLAAGTIPNPWSFTTKSVDTPPTIDAALPSSGATLVNLNETVIVQFSKAMMESSVHFTCTPDTSGWVTSWNGPATAVRYSHTNNFTASTNYTFQITSGQDVAGTNLVSGSVPNPWSFTTISSPSNPLKVYLLSPNGGEILHLNDAFSINWTISGGSSPYTVSLFLSTDGGTTFRTQILNNRAQASSGKGQYLWTVPSIDSSICTVRVNVTDSLSAHSFDLSNTTFSITSGSVLGTLIGNITESGSGTGIAGANVILTDLSNAKVTTTTDANGYYSITGIIPGTYWLNVTKDGYDIFSVQITISSGINSKDVTLVKSSQPQGFPYLLACGIPFLIVFLILILLLLFNIFGLRMMIFGRRRKKTDEPAPPIRASMYGSQPASSPAFRPTYVAPPPAAYGLPPPPAKTEPSPVMATAGASAASELNEPTTKPEEDTLVEVKSPPPPPIEPSETPILVPIGEPLIPPPPLDEIPNEPNKDDLVEVKSPSPESVPEKPDLIETGEPTMPPPPLDESIKEPGDLVESPAPQPEMPPPEVPVPQEIPTPLPPSPPPAPPKESKESLFDVRCPKCGKLNDLEDQNCFWCGANL